MIATLSIAALSILAADARDARWFVGTDVTLSRAESDGVIEFGTGLVAPSKETTVVTAALLRFRPIDGLQLSAKWPLLWSRPSKADDPAFFVTANPTLSFSYTFRFVESELELGAGFAFPEVNPVVVGPDRSYIRFRTPAFDVANAGTGAQEPWSFAWGAKGLFLPARYQHNIAEHLKVEGRATVGLLLATQNSDNSRELHLYFGPSAGVIGVFDDLTAGLRALLSVRVRPQSFLQLAAELFAEYRLDPLVLSVGLVADLAGRYELGQGGLRAGVGFAF